jgi:hypothetical protein
MRSAIRLGLTLGALATAAIIAACGGSREPAPATQPSAAGSTTQSPSPPAAVVDPTATPEPAWSLDFDAITPVAFTEAPSSANQTLGGAADWEAEAEISSALAAAGFQAGVFVLPISGTDDWLLIIEVDDDAITPLFEDPTLSDAVSRAIANSTAVQEGRISRLAINWYSLDEEGPFVLTTTMPTTALLGRLDGTMTDEEAQAETLFEIVRSDQP